MAQYLIRVGAYEGEAKDFQGKAAPYKIFMRRHPEFDAEYWQELNCLFRGGRTLLGNDKVMRRLFPRHRNETETVYQERLKCAHYIPWAGEIVGNTVSGCFRDPLVVSAGEEDEELPEFYKEFIADVSRSVKRTKQSIQQFTAERLLSALVKGKSWAQVDMPAVDGEFDDRLSEERAGAGRTYLIPLEREDVIDWELDEDGDLLWAMTMQTINRRSTPDDDRKMVTERFTVMDAEGFQVFELTYDLDKKKPTEKTMVPLISESEHSFGMVPLICLDLSEQLWSMDKMEPACRALLRDLNELLWSKRQNLLPDLYEFLGPEIGPATPVSDAQADPNRGTNQQRGPGYVQVRGHEDRAEYVGPPSDVYEIAMKIVDMHRDEMHRVNNQMHVNSDVDNATIRRSAESKEKDVESSNDLYKEIGRFLREFVQDILICTKSGRRDGDDVIEDIRVTGCAKFTQKSKEKHIDSAVLVQGMEIESPTFDRKLKMSVVEEFFGGELSDDVRMEIESELEDNIRDEDFQDRAIDMDAVRLAMQGQGEDEDEEDDDLPLGSPLKRPPR